MTPAKASYKTFNAHLMIEFTEFTSIKLADNPPKTFPKYVYALTSFDRIVPAQGSVPTLTGGFLNVSLSIIQQGCKRKISFCGFLFVFRCAGLYYEVYLCNGYNP